MRDHQDQVIFEAIKPLAFAVRQILERYSRSHNDAMFENFPKGTCGPTAELLGRYLLESAGMQAGYVGGERPGGITHAWVDVKGIVVDITADQFGQAPRPPA